MIWIFANPDLERKVQKAVNKSMDELGGWFFVDHEPLHWPGNFSYKRTKWLLETTHFRFINQVLFAPNVEEKKPSEQYRVWDWQKAKDLVEHNASILGGMPVHFHSHPNGVGKPSDADIAFAGSWCKVWEGLSQFAIVTPYPFKVWPYDVSWGNPRRPDNAGLVTGMFYSWHTTVVKKLLV